MRNPYHTIHSDSSEVRSLSRRHISSKRRRKRGRKRLLSICMAAAVFAGGVSLGSLYLAANPASASETAGLLSANSEGNSAYTSTQNEFLTLASSAVPLPAGFVPDALTAVEGYKVDSRIASDLTAMLQAARAEGLSPIICSGYRSIEKQTSLFENKVARLRAQGYSQADAEQEAVMAVARPGTSEHNLGLAVDIVAQSYQHLDDKQADTAEAAWLAAHCHEYGFILRYPADKSDITGIIYEPWHFRYVGREAASEIMSRGVTLEEYLG